MGTFFYTAEPLLVSLILIVLLITASQLGYRTMLIKIEKQQKTIEKGDLALILGAVMTLLALLLGFTYSMSASRYDARRALVVQEANSIGTTFLRAQTLPEPRRTEARDLLREYANLRVKISQRPDTTLEEIREMDILSKQIHNQLWDQAVATAREKPDPISASYFQTLNETIDLHTKRLAAFHNRVPFSIYLVLWLVSSVVVFLVGIYLGFSRNKAHFLMLMLAVLLSSVMWLIMDLDQPSRGLIRTDQSSLIDIQHDLNTPLPVRTK